MESGDPVVRWRFAEDEPAPNQKRSRQGFLSRRRLSLILTLFLLLCAAGLYLLRQANAGYQQIRSDLGEEVAATLILCSIEADVPFNLTPADPFCPPASWLQNLTDAPQPQIESLALHEDRATLIVRLPTAEGEDYRIPLFYRRDSGGWLRYEPGLVEMGARRSLAGTLAWRYRANEEELVLAAAPLVEDVLTELRSILGLSPRFEPRIVFETEPRLPAVANRIEESGTGAYRRITLLSPLNMALPVEADPVEVLADQAVRQLAQTTLDEALAGEPIPYRWQSMLDGVFLALQRSADPLPHRRVTENDIKMSLISDWDVLVLRLPVASRTNSAKIWAAQSLADYLLAEYDVVAVSGMVRAFPEHESWETLLPFAFGEEAEVVQQGWRAFAEEMGSP